MKALLNGLLVCLLTIALILPIGIGIWNGVSISNQTIDDNSSQNEEVEVGLSLSESEVIFNIGATKTLIALTEVESDSYIYQWASDNKDVVAVKRGATSPKACVITALSEGVAKVTINVIDKSQFKIIASASCDVKIIDSSISFSKDEVVISLDEGNTATITAKAPEDGEITWSSEDESIATVVDGVITAHKAGQVYIVARSGNVEGKVLVKIYDSLFTLEETTQVSVGSTVTVGVNGTLSEDAVWTSSDERIVSVDQNGVITGVKKGMATVKVSSAKDGLTATCVVMVKGSGAEKFVLESGKKATAAANFGKWYFLCESTEVSVDPIPTMDNGLMSVNITEIGTSGANMFYLRYQADDVGDVIYKHTLYIYSEVDKAHLQINGKDNYLVAGLNRIEMEYTSSAPKAVDPYQIKFRSKGMFYVIPMFEEISRIEKMTLSESTHTLNTGSNNTFTLTATVPGQDNPAIEWVSSDGNVCTVVNGVVTAVGEGSSMITAISGNFSATCLVTVEGETPIEGTELASGNKSATVKSPGNWFYLADGKSKVLNKPILDSDGNIHMSITNIDSANKKYVYLRYQPETVGVKYKVTVTIEFAGVDGSGIDFTGGDVSSAVSYTVNNGTNTIEFEFTSNSSNPLQMKFFAIGGYVVNVVLSEA